MEQLQLSTSQDRPCETIGKCQGTREAVRPKVSALHTGVWITCSPSKLHVVALLTLEFLALDSRLQKIQKVNKDNGLNRLL